MSALPQIQVELSPKAKGLLARFEKLPSRVPLAIARGWDKADGATVSNIQRYFLSFPKHGPTRPDGLRAISNRLRNSIRASKAVISGDVVTASIGSNISYAAVHEFGFVGTVMVGGHVRKRFQQKEFLTKSGRATRRNVRVGDVMVAPHKRKMNLPARAPIQRGIKMSLPMISKIISAEIIKELEGQQ